MKSIACGGGRGGTVCQFPYNALKVLDFFGKNVALMSQRTVTSDDPLVNNMGAGTDAAGHDDAVHFGPFGFSSGSASFASSSASLAASILAVAASCVHPAKTASSSVPGRAAYRIR